MVPAVLALLAVVAPAWTRTDLPVPKSHPAMFVASRSVNAHGDAIYEGMFRSAGHLSQAGFLWHRGRLRSLTYRYSNWVDVNGLNDAGTVVGDAGARAVVWRDGTPTVLAPAPSSAQAINDRGTIIGQDARDPVVWRNGVETQLDSIGSVTAINANDDVIGETPVGGGLTHAMLWQNGVTTDLGSVGDTTSWANDINDHGEIVGNLSTPTGFPLTAVEWRNGRLIDLGRFGALGAQAVAVNNAGDVLIQLTDDAGNPSAIVLVRDGTPIPIPGDVARTVDEQGQVLGYVQTAGHGRRSFVWRNGKEATLPTSDGVSPPWGAPNVIAGGWAVGDEYVALGNGHDTAHAVLWHRG